MVKVNRTACLPLRYGRTARYRLNAHVWREANLCTALQRESQIGQLVGSAWRTSF